MKANKTGMMKLPRRVLGRNGHAKKILRELKNLLPPELLISCRPLGADEDEVQIMKQSGWTVKYAVSIQTSESSQIGNYVMANHRDIPQLIEQIGEKFPKEMDINKDPFEKPYKVMQAHGKQLNKAFGLALGHYQLKGKIEPISLHDLKQGTTKDYQLPKVKYHASVWTPGQEKDFKKYGISGRESFPWLMQQIKEQFLGDDSDAG